jgi:DNA (cytosine-5)-methyltransferase 1
MSWEQLSLYTEPPLKIKNKVRLIELFSGIGAQAKALERLGVDFEHWRAYDIDKYAVASYNAVHGTDFEVGDITKIHAEDLGITDRDDFTYLLTYSFPCQDLSIAGGMKGMSRKANSRSGLLWEVERLLIECGEDLPQILVMENVPQILSEQNKHDFGEWRESLRNMGYTNDFRLLNAKDYGIPQNRERCFMVSWLGEYTYEFPEPIELKLTLRDVLEKDVDESYYLSPAQTDTFRPEEGGGMGWNCFKQNREQNATAQNL